MNDRLIAWARGRRSRPGLLIRAKLGTSEPGDASLAGALAEELGAAPVAPGLAAAAWRLIELMDLGPVPPEWVESVLSLLRAERPPVLPLRLPSGVVIVEPDAATIAGTALALRALTKAHRATDPAVRAALDDLARRGPGMEGAVRRASALHGIAADHAHYPAAIDRLVAGLAAMQRHDGGWGDGELFHVAQALLAVEHPDADRALRRGAGALADAQEEDGGFGSEERSWIACRWLGRLGGQASRGR